jgi:PAS domain S-box-containing protein
MKPNAIEEVPCSSPLQEPSFLLLVAGAPRWFLASEIVDALERGLLDLETPTSVAPGREPKPLRVYLRELVFLAHQAKRHSAPVDPVTHNPFRLAFECAPVGVVLTDLSGRIVFANRAFGVLLGRPVAELHGVLIGDISLAEDHDAEVELGNQLFAGDRQGFTIEKRFIGVEGAVPCTVHVSLVRDAGDRPRLVAGTVIDRRPAEQLEALRTRLRSVSRVQAIARRVSHDVGNVLAVVGSASWVLREVDEAAPRRDALNAIDQSVELMDTLNTQLMSLSVPPGRDEGRVDLSAEVVAIREFLEQLVGSERAFELSCSPVPAWVGLAQPAVRQVLLNLVSNAAQATPAGGRVSVLVSASPSGTRLVVEDTGCGMTREVRERAMEPYFSAREGGTGIGLSIVEAAVVRARAHLDIDSTPGLGTRITLSFPIVPMAERGVPMAERG